MFATFPRDEFIRDYWHWKPGQHVTVIGPNGSGKTHLGYQLLGATARPQTPAVVFAMKPRDSTVTNFTKQYNFKMIRTWPPINNIWQGKPAGYTLWPKHRFDPDLDEPEHWKIFRHAILDSYKRGNRILFADETYSLCEELGLEKELITVWTKGRSMNTSLWGATQRPAWVPLWMYDQAQHLFMAYDPDERARKRYAEIGGVDPLIVRNGTRDLRKYEFLYIQRETRTMCVVGP